MIGAGSILVPDDEVVALLALGERDVARGARPYRVDRLDAVADVAGGYVEQPVGGERLRDRDRVHAAEAPQLLAVEIVGAHLRGAGGDELGALLVAPDEGRGPIGALVTVDPPQLASGRRVERHDEGLLLVVVDDEELAVREHGRGRGSPAHARGLR